MLNVRMGFCNLLVTLIQFGVIMASDQHRYRTVVYNGKELHVRATMIELMSECVTYEQALRLFQIEARMNSVRIAPVGYNKESRFKKNDSFKKT